MHTSIFGRNLIMRTFILSLNLIMYTFSLKKTPHPRFLPGAAVFSNTVILYSSNPKYRTAFR